MQHPSARTESATRNLATRQADGRPSTPVLRLLPSRARKQVDAAEQNAAICLEMFLCAAFGPCGDASVESLATALFALGALDAAADSASLGRSGRNRLELWFLGSFYGMARREAAAWRRALRRFEATRRGFEIRRQGEAALRAWLTGEAPHARLAEVFGDA